MCEHLQDDIKTKIKKVLCVGLCCLDIVMYCEKYPLEDSDQRCRSNKWQRGGNASNNCSVFAEFGVPCEVLGTLSGDVGGQFMRKSFTDCNICFENCPCYDEYDSPFATVWINCENGSRTIVSSDKNIPEIQLEAVKRLNLEDYCWIHVECRHRNPEMVPVLEYLFKNKDKNCPMSIEVEKPNPKQVEFLPFADFVFISKDFAMSCGCSDMISAVETLHTKLKSGAAIICAWGELGASLKSAKGPIITHPAFPPAKIVNTLGAGDTFVATTIIGFLEGHNIEQSVMFGCKVAGAKCGMEGIHGLAKLFST